MSMDVEIRGELELADAAAAKAALVVLRHPDMDLEEEAEELLDGIRRRGASLAFEVEVSLPASGNLMLQDWLEDLAEGAVSGAIDVWQNGGGVRIKAGGGEVELDDREGP